MRKDHHDALTWPHEWIDWPDFLLPRDRTTAITRITALHKRAVAGERVEVACGAGVGRTGTVMACLAILAGLPAKDAITWTRANYHHRAVETPWQRRWVTRFPSRTS
jgi:protein-tyrosine phosphatase